ncbi:MAG: beta strand repeat-containing protein [Eubacterium sp.]|jgi:hypothetical protein
MKMTGKKIWKTAGAITLAAVLTLVPVASFAASSAPPGGSASGGGADTQTYDYSGTMSGALTADGEEVTSDGETTVAETADQNAALATNGGTLTITNGTLTKSGDDTNGDNCNFYGINSIALAVGDGTTMYISDSSLSADSEGSNGVFSTDNATAYVYNTSIDTTAGNSRGLDATYSGTIIADSLTIATEGDHSASLATDRGGGNISVTNSTLSTAGSGSPLLYSTGTIEVSNVTGTASGSQIAGMEGLNTILIFNSDLTSTITGATASDPVADGVIIYQSTSGDADTSSGETALFQAVNSKLSSSIQSGAMFYITNTTAKVILKDTELNFDSDSAKLLYIAGNDSNNWGTAGSNGGTVTFAAIGETLDGDITVDTISSLNLYLQDSTTYTGAITIEENANGTSDGSGITVNVDSGSTWVVTGDSTVTNLNVADGGKVVDESGNTVTITANGSTAVEGTSSVTVTVTGSYSTTVDETIEAEAASIDRTDFDSYYGTSTAIAETVSDESENDTEATEDTDSAEETTEDTAEEQDGIGTAAIIIIIAVAACIVIVIAVRHNAKKKQ